MHPSTSISRRHCVSFIVAAVAVLAVCVFAVGVADGASSGKLPRLFDGGPNGASAVRPPVIENASSDGGEMKLHWTSWTKTQADGHGTSYPDHGSSPVRVHAFAPLKGEFTHMTLSIKYKGVWNDRLMVVAYIPGLKPSWADADSVAPTGMKLWTG